MLQQVNDVSVYVGLKKNYNKTKIMCYEQAKITIENFSTQGSEIERGCWNEKKNTADMGPKISQKSKTSSIRRHMHITSVSVRIKTSPLPRSALKKILLAMEWNRLQETRENLKKNWWMTSTVAGKHWIRVSKSREKRNQLREIYIQKWMDRGWQRKDDLQNTSVKCRSTVFFVQGWQKMFIHSGLKYFKVGEDWRL